MSGAEDDDDLDFLYDEDDEDEQLLGDEEEILRCAMCSRNWVRFYSYEDCPHCRIVDLEKQLAKGVVG